MKYIVEYDSSTEHYVVQLDAGWWISTFHVWCRHDTPSKHCNTAITPSWRFRAPSCYLYPRNAFSQTLLMFVSSKKISEYFQKSTLRIFFFFQIFWLEINKFHFIQEFLNLKDYIIKNNFLGVKFLFFFLIKLYFFTVRNFFST